MRQQGEDALPYMPSEDRHTAKDAASSVSRCNSSTSSSASSVAFSAWLPRFKMWLPAYLDGVYKRLKDGEVYPLSALKGDFRANCGVDMDHSSIGYSKLSEFIKSVPELCKMKIATVGKGPATHTVLLPASAHRRSMVSNQVHISTTTSPLVSRIYGAPLRVSVPPIHKRATVTMIETVSRSQNLYRGQHDVAYVYCVFCGEWRTESNWMGIPYSHFGICSICKEDTGPLDKLKRNHRKVVYQHQQPVHLHGEKISLFAEQLVVDKLALISEKLVADKFSLISQELRRTNFLSFQGRSNAHIYTDYVERSGTELSFYT